jgi:hypothetical protein
MRLLVVVPTQLKRNAAGRLFLADAIDSIASQPLPCLHQQRVAAALNRGKRWGVFFCLTLKNHRPTNGMKQVCEMHCEIARRSQRPV